MSLSDSSAIAVTDPLALAELKRESRTRTPEALREAARQFESVFTRMMLKSMRDASFGDSLFGSHEGEFYRDMFDDQMAVELSRGRGLGLAEVLVQQLLNSGAVRSLESAAPPPQPAPASGSLWQPRSRTEFIEELLPHALQAGRALGVAPESLLAHAALESAWGQSMPAGPAGQSSHNLFGIKAGASWRGAAVGCATLEFDAGVASRRVERFRAYGSREECFRDYVSLLAGNERYRESLGTGSDATAFAQGLAAGGYATDPAYATKLTAVARSVRAMLDERLKGGSSLPLHDAGNAG